MKTKFFLCAIFLTGASVLFSQTSPNWVNLPLSNKWVFDGASTSSRTAATPYEHSYPAGARGGYDGCRYPNSPWAPPWWFHNNADLTGQLIFRWPGTTHRSNVVSPIKGIRFKGRFNGLVSGQTSGDIADAAVFFHQRSCYDGGKEYGFRKNLISGKTEFYWLDNANCSSSFCKQTRSRSGAPVIERSGAVRLTFTQIPGQNYYWSAYLFWDNASSQYKFKIEVFNSSMSRVYDWVQIPDSWFSANEVASTWGFVTTGILKIDNVPTSLRASSGTGLRVEQVWIGQ